MNLVFDTVSFDVNLTRRRRRRRCTNSQITRQYNSERIYGRHGSGYSGCTRAAIQTRGENGGTNVRELTMYGVCALSETQIAMRTQRQPDEIRSTCERVKPVRAIHVWLSVDTRAPVYNQRDCNWGCTEFNRILIFLFARRMCRTRAADTAQYMKNARYYRYLALIQALPVTIERNRVFAITN